MTTVHTTIPRPFEKAISSSSHCMVPHTTHEMPPLDKAVFCSLKVNWRNSYHDFLYSNPSEVVNKYNFSTLLNEAWMKTMQPQMIVNGLRSCGVDPFNPRTVLDHDLPDDTTEPLHDDPAKLMREKSHYQRARLNHHLTLLLKKRDSFSQGLRKATTFSWIRSMWTG